jgi:hypothetical protein
VCTFADIRQDLRSCAPIRDICAHIRVCTCICRTYALNPRTREAQANLELQRLPAPPTAPLVCLAQYDAVLGSFCTRLPRLLARLSPRRPLHDVATGDNLPLAFDLLRPQLQCPILLCGPLLRPSSQWSDALRQLFANFKAPSSASHDRRLQTVRGDQMLLRRAS